MSLLEKTWENMQIKSFTRWCNAYLSRRGRVIKDLAADFEDGTLLCDLVSELSKKDISAKMHKTPKMKFQKIENLNKALDFINNFVGKSKLKLQFSAEDILEHNSKLILGMLWTLIHKYSLEEIQEDANTAKEGLLLWCKKKVPSSVVEINDFGASWTSGIAFCALLHAHKPEVVDMDKVRTSTAYANIELAFSLAETHFGVPRLLDVEDMLGAKPDEKSVMTYISCCWKNFQSANKEQSFRQLAATLVALDDQRKQLEAQAKNFISWTDAQFKTADPSVFHAEKSKYWQILQHIESQVATAQSTLLHPQFQPQNLRARWAVMQAREQEHAAKSQSQARAQKLETRTKTTNTILETLLAAAFSTLEQIQKDREQDGGDVDRQDSLLAIAEARSRVHNLKAQVAAVGSKSASLRNPRIAKCDSEIERTLTSLANRETELLAKIAAEHSQTFATYLALEDLASRLPASLNDNDNDTNSGGDGDKVEIDEEELLEIERLVQQVDIGGFNAATAPSVIPSDYAPEARKLQIQRSIRAIRTRLSNAQQLEARRSEYHTKASNLENLLLQSPQQQQAVSAEELESQLQDLRQLASLLGDDRAVEPSVAALEAKVAAHVSRSKLTSADEDSDAAVERELVAGFVHFDKDKSGTLSRLEYAALVQSTDGEAGLLEPADRVWARLGLAEGGELTRAQFDELVRDVCAARERRRKRGSGGVDTTLVDEMFRAIRGPNAPDINGIVSVADLKRVLGTSADEYDRFVAILAPVSGSPDLFSYAALLHSVARA
eukprot:ANDGO_03465.mRNA.1 Alpha-actinin